MSLSIEECVDAAARLLREAEMQAIDNPPRCEALSVLAAEWRMLADTLVETSRLS